MLAVCHPLFDIEVTKVYIKKWPLCQFSVTEFVIYLIRSLNEKWAITPLFPVLQYYFHSVLIPSHQRRNPPGITLLWTHRGPQTWLSFPSAAFLQHTHIHLSVNPAHQFTITPNSIKTLTLLLVRKYCSLYTYWNLPSRWSLHWYSIFHLILLSFSHIFEFLLSISPFAHHLTFFFPCSWLRFWFTLIHFDSKLLTCISIHLQTTITCLNVWDVNSDYDEDPLTIDLWVRKITMFC